jgi:hypothetical protein
VHAYVAASLGYDSRMTAYGVVGLVVLGGALVFVVLRAPPGETRSDYARVVLPPTAGQIAADSGVPAPDPLPARDRARAAATETASPERVACAADGGRCELSVRYDCDPRKLRCRRAAPECAAGQVPSVAGSCFGECVPIEACRCTGPEECPLHEQYTCLMSRQHCTPYLH